MTFPLRGLWEITMVDPLQLGLVLFIYYFFNAGLLGTFWFGALLSFLITASASLPVFKGDGAVQGKDGS